MKNLIEKYTKRILIDYPEEDKIHIDLEQFGKEYAEQHRLEGIIEALESHKITCEMFSDWSAQTLAYGMLKEEIEKYQEQLKNIKEVAENPKSRQ